MSCMAMGFISRVPALFCPERKMRFLQCENDPLIRKINYRIER